MYKIRNIIKSILTLSLVQFCLYSCTTAIGVRNPEYNKKISTIAVLNFSGPQELSEQVSAAFTSAIKRLKVVGVYMPHQVQEFLTGQGLAVSDPNESSARKILASKLNIDALISGQVVQYDNTYRESGNIEVIVRLIDIETEEQIYSAAVRTDKAGILTGRESEMISAAIDSIIDDIKNQFDL